MELGRAEGEAAGKDWPPDSLRRQGRGETIGVEKVREMRWRGGSVGGEEGSRDEGEAVEVGEEV